MSKQFGYSGDGGTHLFDTAEERDEFAGIFDDEIEPWRERFYDEYDDDSFGSGFFGNRDFDDYEGCRDEVER